MCIRYGLKKYISWKVILTELRTVWSALLTDADDDKQQLIREYLYTFHDSNVFQDWKAEPKEAWLLTTYFQP